MTDRQLWLTPNQVHDVEQRWAAAEDMLDVNLERLRNDLKGIADATGITDTSMVFDYMWAQIMKMEMSDPTGMAHKATMLMCAAAFTRLARQAPRADDDPLARLENEVNNDNDS